MTKTLTSFCCLMAAMACSTVQAQITFDFTTSTDGAGNGIPTTSFFGADFLANLFGADFSGNGSISGDVDLSVLGGSFPPPSVDSSGQGIGVAAGPTTEVDAGEGLTIRFGNQAPSSDPVVGFNFIGLITEATSETWAFDEQDNISFTQLIVDSEGFLQDGITETFTGQPVSSLTPLTTGLNTTADNFVLQSLSTPIFIAENAGADILVNNGSIRVQGFLAEPVFQSQAVPEPTSLTILCLGGLSLIARRRR